MRNLFKGLFLALLFALGAIPARAVDPFFPTFGNDGIDVLHYNIDLDVNPHSGNVKAKTALFIRANARLTSFSLDLHGFTVSQVRLNGQEAEFDRTADKLVITPVAPLSRGTVFSVEVAYDGVPEAIEDPTAPGFGLTLGWFKYLKSTYVVSEPVGASTFFPANDEPTDKATYSFAVTVPFDYVGVANGRLTGSTLSGNKRRFEWSMSQPMTSWLATVHVNRFNVKLTAASGGTPVRVYYPGGTPQSHVEVYALASEMLTYFETLVGRYPFASYGSVVVRDPILYYALETQAMSVFPAEFDAASLPSEGLIAHELAHQWFGNSISVANWEDLWIAEGIATYFEAVWNFRDDPAGFDAEMLAIYDYVAAEEIGPAVVEAADQLFTDRTYYRGAAALYALRQKAGDDIFFRILRRFAQDNRGGNVTSAGFIRTAVQVSGDASVRPLLQAWLYDDPVPALPGMAARKAKRGSVPKPDLLGSRCGRGSHRGAPATCE